MVVRGSVWTFPIKTCSAFVYSMMHCMIFQGRWQEIGKVFDEGAPSPKCGTQGGGVARIVLVNKSVRSDLKEQAKRKKKKKVKTSPGIVSFGSLSFNPLLTRTLEHQLRSTL